MKTDAYTKIVLTLIAVCLSYQTLKDVKLIATVEATVEATETEYTLPKTQYQLVPINNNNTLDVRIVDINTYDELNVNIKGVDTREVLKVDLSNISTNQELDVNIDEISGNFIPFGNGLPVVIKQ